MSKKKSQSLAVNHDFQKEELLENAINSLNRNVIILSHNIRLKGNTRKALQIWLYRLDKLFQDLGKGLSDTEKIDIALRTADDEMVESIICKHITRYNEFQNFVMNNNDQGNNEMFKVNEWVRIYEEKNSIYDKEKYETGIVVKMCENGLYEVACKDKALKIHGSNLTKI